MNSPDYIQIKPAVIEDSPFIVLAQLSMALETENIELDKDRVTIGIMSVFENPDKGFYIIALNGETKCGCLLITPEWSDWRNAWIWWIQSVYVIPGCRHKGVFRLMYTNIKQQVIDREDIYGIRLYVDNTNKSAQEVYARMGMNGGHYRTFEWMK
jgi:L-amino acid N-acyltransferase YncA